LDELIELLDKLVEKLLLLETEDELLLEELLNSTIIVSLEELLDRLDSELELRIDDEEREDELVIATDELLDSSIDDAELELRLAVTDDEEDDGIGLGSGDSSPDEPPPQAVSTALITKTYRLRAA